MKPEAELVFAADLHVHAVASGHAYSTIADEVDLAPEYLALLDLAWAELYLICSEDMLRGRTSR